METPTERLDRIRDDCRKMVTKRALVAAGASVVPVPGADMVADIGILTTLLPKISEKFGLDHDQVASLDPQNAQKVLVFASGLGNSMIGRRITREIVVRLLKRIGIRLAAGSAAKYVPFLGSVVAAGIGFGAMKLIGNRHIEDCYKTARQLEGQGKLAA